MGNGLGIFDPTKSNRTNILYQAIQPYVSDNTSILDIGCGTAPLASYLDDDADYFGFDNNGEVIAGLTQQYPKFKFRRVNYKEGDIGFIDKKHDVVIHIGIDSWEWTPIWEIHSAILERPELRPDHVLLEVGYRPEYMGCYQSCRLIMTVYTNHNYSIKDEGLFSFEVEGHHLKNRAWSVLGK